MGSVWDKAKDRLSAPDRVLFDTDRDDKRAILNDILQAVQKQNDECLRRRWKIKGLNGKEIFLRDVCGKFLFWIKEFMSVVDVAVQYDPVHSSLPWAGIRFLLQLGVSDTHVFENLVEGLEIVARVVARYSIFEEIYLTAASKAQQHLTEQLVELYAAILRYLCSAKKYYDRNTATRMIVTALRPPELDDAILHITKEEESVRRQADLVDAEKQQNLILLSTDTYNTVEASVSGILELKSKLHSLEAPFIRTVAQLSDIQDHMDKARRKELLLWLSRVPYRQHHESYSANTLPGSGKWLLEDSKYTNWKSTSNSQILWLHGNVGCGKTTLISIVIQQLVREASNTKNAAPIAYFYCSRNSSETERDDPCQVLRALTKQLSLVNRQRSILKPTLDMYTHKQLKAEEDGLEPSGLSISECVELILKITATTSVTLVIDALDECCSRTRHELFSVLKRIVAESHNVAKILVSSRQDSDIDAHFDCQEQIRVTEDQTHGDLNRFIEAQVTAAVQGRRILPGQEISPALHKSIVEGLKSKAHGMFQWISLQIENLCDSGRLKREEDVHRAIAGLPKSLSKSYDMILRRVREMESTSCKIALHTFMWLLGAKRLLSTHELLAAVSWSVLQRPDGISKRDVLRCCLNLVTADLSLDTFRFSHPSVFEYLKAGRESHGLPHEDLLLTTCLRTLVNHKSKALRSYSTTYWGSHLDTSSKATCLPVESRGLFETFLVEDEHLEVWLDDLDALLETESYLHGELVRKLRSVRSTPVSPLFAISCFGIDCYWLRCTRIREKVSRWDQLNSRGASALYLAACWGVCDLVQLLIDQKVDVNIAGGRFGSALQVAAHNGHREVVRLLLRHGAEPRGSEYFPDPMSAAVAGGHGNMVRFMLGNGLRFTDRQSFAACRDLALFDGQAELVRFLLDRFPEHFKPEEHEDQLQAALYARKEKMVRELIDGQIDVEKQTGPFGNALQAAICGGKLDLVELIINSGADLNCRGRYGYPLRAAVIFEHEEIVHWLLENKQADANIADNDLGDCLQAAAFKGNTRLMKLLLDHGARVEPCRTELKQSLGGVYGIPLHAAAAAGHHNAVELLMERGADVYAHWYGHGTRFCDAMDAAAWSESEGLEEFMARHHKYGSMGGGCGNAGRDPG